MLSKNKFCVCDVFRANMSVLHMCLLPREAWKHHSMLWNWYLSVYWEANIDPLQAQQMLKMLLATKSYLQSQVAIFDMPIIMLTTYLFSSMERFFLKYLYLPRLLVLFQKAFLLFIGKHCWCHRLGTLRAHCYCVSVYLDIFWIQTLEIFVCYSDMHHVYPPTIHYFFRTEEFFFNLIKVFDVTNTITNLLIFLFLFIYLFYFLTIASPYTIHPSQ